MAALDGVGWAIFGKNRVSSRFDCFTSFMQVHPAASEPKRGYTAYLRDDMSELKTSIEELCKIDENIRKNMGLMVLKRKDNVVQEILLDVKSFIEARVKVKMHLAQNTTFITENPIHKEYLKKVISNSHFVADEIVKVLAKDDSFLEGIAELEDDEIDALSSDLLFSWLGPREFIEGLIEIGVFISEFKIPKKLEHYIDEARKCYAFQQYNAVNSLARTILEIALRDICVQKGIIDKAETTNDFFHKHRPRKLIKKISNGQLQEELLDLYENKLSPIAHGYKTIQDKKVKIELKSTLQTVEKLYKNNAKELKNTV